MSYRDYEPVDLARAGFKIHQLESLEKDNIENAFSGYVADALGQINDGKEATVYLCRGGPAAEVPWLAAKIFKARVFRAFNTDHNYRNVGKQRDRRMARAMKKRSRTGDQAFHRHWIDSEWRTLNRLYDAGVRVPKPVAASADGVLMEFVVDDGGPAPRLVNCHLAEAGLQRCAEQLRADIVIMLDLGIVHGDLSPYNILMSAGDPVIIDVPQAMDMHSTPNAWSLMQRDLSNLEHWFERKGLQVAFTDLLYPHDR